ncbi:Extracellular Endonuclease, subunit A,DNA/RNA non-specific endonuclease [Cinara cedri]|uniref:Extracellular Endonuclease, subunit A,DNA/RNA non-specific endonuclease n=1 Tax=Cinara cedri TaxID=506608 RepID=A0A5E4N232_9HEMI|nr:Extracellular Endonuclease, subunit A,DNA/RNA non-specific endonuclease [Cinara cedri]
MYWTTLTVLVTFSCLHLTVLCSADEHNIKTYSADYYDAKDCRLSVADNAVALKMPVPFRRDDLHRHSIIYPDSDGRLRVKFLHGFKMSCTTAGKFASADLSNVTEVLVVCAGDNSLWYLGREYAYADFVCNREPRSELTVTDETCQGDGVVVAVGFQTESAYLGAYRVCFDKATKNSLYSWYDSRSPYYDQHQSMKKRPSFVASRQLYGNTNVNKLYTVAQQRKTVAKILRSDSLANMYIKNDNNHSLSRGHYTPKADFYFGFEQSATFYYANVAPQWQSFNGYAWNHLEMWTRYRMDNSTGRRVIVTGTYGSCTLPDVDGVEQPLFLDPPTDIPVPLFYWKLYYDADAEDGMVYVGLNNPYMKIDESAYICPNLCPDGYRGNGDTSYVAAAGKNDENDGLIYCCSKESFEEVYGRLDPIVFRSV